MADVQAVVHIVEAKGNFGVHIEVLGGEALVLLGGVQLGEDLRRVSAGHQGSVAPLQGVSQGIRVQSRVVHIDAGINDGDFPSGTGVTGSPGGGGADHFVGGGHHGVRGQFFLDHAGLIAPLHQHFFHAGDRFDGGNIAIFHVGGNDVCGQGQIPDHVQVLSVQGLPGNGGLHSLLLAFQGLTIGHGIAAESGDIVGSEALFQGGGVLQNDGYSNDVRILVQGFLGFFRADFVPAGQPDVVFVSADLLKGQLAALFAGTVRCHGRQGQSQGQDQGQQHRNELLKAFLFHMLATLFLRSSRVSVFPEKHPVSGIFQESSITIPSLTYKCKRFLSRSFKSKYRKSPGRT